jgi:hypothetical protein
MITGLLLLTALDCIGCSTSHLSSNASPSSTQCTSRAGTYGAMKVCPGSGPVGTVVHIYSSSLCGAASLNGVTVEFLGPGTFIGLAGGGAEVPGPLKADGGGFVVTYRVPPTYIRGEPNGPVATTSISVTAGTGYSFATYPAGACDVPFIVLKR